MPLRQYPSAHDMRQTDGLRQHRPDPPSVNHNHNPNPQYSKSFLDKVLPPSSRHDFHDHGAWPSRQSSAPNGTARQRSRSDAPTSPTSPTLDVPPTPAREPPARLEASGASSTQEHDRSKQLDLSRSPSFGSQISSDETYETQATSTELPALQTRSALEDTDQMEPLADDIQGSFDLTAPPADGHQLFSLEHRSELLFSRAHLDIIFSNPSSLLRFTAFLSTHRPQSVPMLIYYLDALKALKAIKYSNAIAEALTPIPGFSFTAQSSSLTANRDLERKADEAFTILTQQALPAFITQVYIRVVSISIARRITGTLAPHLRDASEGLAEVFCLTDPSRPDNPIVFASEEFNRTTQYGLSYVIGRNCRFLQGPKTHPLSPRRLGDAVRSGQEHCEVFLNYRRDGSPFMNMLMIAPLCDSRGKIRYFIGAQVDVSGLAKDCTDLESLQQLVQQEQSDKKDRDSGDNDKDDFLELSAMLNIAELETVRKHGGRMHREYREDDPDHTHSKAPHMPRLLLQEPVSDAAAPEEGQQQSGRLSGIYQNYLLIRPAPSFRILFASPTLRIPGILQSPFLDRIGGSSRVRDELSTALAEGRGVTAKIRWLSRADEGGRNRWIHCTPLIGSNGQIGVWMIVLIDDEQEIQRRWRQAPPVALGPAGPHRGRANGAAQLDGSRSSESIRVEQNGSDRRSNRVLYHERQGAEGHSVRSSSPSSLII